MNLLINQIQIKNNFQSVVQIQIKNGKQIYQKLQSNIEISIIIQQIYNQQLSTTQNTISMNIQGEIELQSDRKLQDQPVIGTQILDGNMPSQINFEGLKNGKIKNKGSDVEKNMNPEQISLPEYKDGIIVLKQFNVRGKGIFDVQTKYKQDDVIPVKDKKFSVKALNCQGNRGLLNIWQSMLGYSKKQLIIEDGQVYVTQLVKNQNILQRAYKLTNLIKIFIDPEQKSLRLVFKSQNVPKKRIARDFQTEQLASVMQKLLIQCNVIGLEVIPDDF